MTNMYQDLEILRKSLLYRSWYRGCKETDILLGNFAKQQLELLDAQELQEYAAILEESDNDIYAWITGQQMPPVAISTRLIERITQFHHKS